MAPRVDPHPDDYFGLPWCLESASRTSKAILGCSYLEEAVQSAEDLMLTQDRHGTRRNVAPRPISRSDTRRSRLVRSGTFPLSRVTYRSRAPGAFALVTPIPPTPISPRARTG